MAVKPEIIKARLKVLFPKANLSTKRIDTIVAKLAPMPADDADDAAVDVILNQANDFMSFDEIAREDDRIRTLEEKAGTIANPTPPAPTTHPSVETPEWVKTILDRHEKLQADIEAIKTGKIADTKRQTAQKVFESSEILKGMKPEIKESWLTRINIDSETTIEDQVKGLETEYADIRQSVADTTNYSGGTPYRTKGEGDVLTDKEVETILGN